MSAKNVVNILSSLIHFFGDELLSHGIGITIEYKCQLTISDILYFCKGLSYWEFLCQLIHFVSNCLAHFWYNMAVLRKEMWLLCQTLHSIQKFKKKWKFKDTRKIFFTIIKKSLIFWHLKMFNNFNTILIQLVIFLISAHSVVKAKSFFGLVLSGIIMSLWNHVLVII